jgi:4'-phosphopantetheinyl transferase
MMTLFPVILAVPPDKQKLKGREKVGFLSRYARIASEQSAARSGIRLGGLEKNGNGVPLPSGGVYWSVSHKPLYVAGVVSREPIGIDIERIRTYTKGLEKKVADDSEWALVPRDRSELLFRFWTAKEAVLKQEGVGLAGLSACKIVADAAESGMTLRFRDQDFQVAHITFDNHIAAIVKQSNTRIQWIINDPEVKSI